MKLLRNNIFETNSSSTHSLVIEPRKKHTYKSIPRNSKEIFIVDEYGTAHGGDEELVINTIEDEVDKLRFMCNILATVCDSYRYEKYNISEGYKWEEYYDAVDKKAYMKPFWDKMMNLDIFVVLKEAIFEVTGTYIDFIQPEGSAPFYECVYIENDDISELFHIKDPFDKDDFKEFIIDLIFNEDIVIKDANIPYSCDYEL